MDPVIPWGEEPHLSANPAERCRRRSPWRWTATTTPGHARPAMAVIHGLNTDTDTDSLWDALWDTPIPVFGALFTHKMRFPRGDSGVAA